MKTVYFPDTHLDPRRAEQLAAIWGRLTLLQPAVETYLPDMAALQEAGIIEMIFPASDAPDSLNDVLQELKQWAAQHSGGDLAALMEQGQAVPFFDGHSSAQIVADVRQKSQTPVADPVHEGRQQVFKARLFLAMAQEFDLQQAALRREIAALGSKEREMMALLKGEAAMDTTTSAALSGDATVAGLDPRMIAMRLQAWARAMAAVEEMETLSGKGAEILYLTTNRGVWGQIQELFPEAEIRLQGHHPVSGRTSVDVIERLPAWLAGPLSADSGDTPGTDDEPSPGFDLIEIPDTSVATFLLRLSGQPSRKGSDGVFQTSAGSCWIGCLTPAGEAGTETLSGS